MSVRPSKSGLVFDHAINSVTGDMACDRAPPRLAAKRGRPADKRVAVDVAFDEPQSAEILKLIPNLNRLP